MKHVERTVIAAFSLLSLYGLIEFLDATFDRHGWTRLDASAWASWVQAVGSIAALGIAIYVMSKQNAHAARLVADADRIATLRKVNSVRAILRRYYAQLSTANATIQSFYGRLPHVTNDDGRKLAAAYDALKGIPANLQAIPVFEIGSFELAQAVLEFSEIASECLTGLHAMNTPMPNVSTGSRNVFMHLVSGAYHALQDYENAASALENERAPRLD